MLGWFLPSEFVGFYSAAFTLIGSIYSFMLISEVLLPVFTQMNKNNLPNSFNRVLKYIFLISIPIVFGSFIFVFQFSKIATFPDV